MVFVAGASDVDHLIIATLRLISSLDKVLCPSFEMSLQGVRGPGVAPAGWGRPQERINPLVRKCDLFIGIVSRRFGHSSGVAATGTIEEYDIVSKLRRLSGRSPEILLFFRKTPQSPVVRRNLDLLRIQEFKHRISDELLWVEFNSERDFEILCLEQLIAYVLTKGNLVVETDPEATGHADPQQTDRSTQSGEDRDGNHY